MILENPATQPHYLLYPANFIPYTFVDMDRRKRGDYFKKPTAYWFFNCEPTNGKSFQKPCVPSRLRRISRRSWRMKR